VAVGHENRTDSRVIRFSLTDVGKA